MGKLIKLGTLSQSWVFIMGDIFIRSDGVRVELLPVEHCKCCSKPISDNYFYGTRMCSDCYKEENRPPIKIHAVGIYILRTADNQISQDIWELKQNPKIADKLGECMVYIINERYPYLKDMDLIVPVPSSDLERGYSQTLLLANYVSKEIGIECKEIIYSDDNHAPQHNTPLDRKKSNIDHEFNCDGLLTDKKILLIDDTYVTGNTMRECFRVLKECDAKEVQGLVLGREVTEEHMEYIKENQ